jgi:hypothetical protein
MNSLSRLLVRLAAGAAFAVAITPWLRAEPPPAPTSLAFLRTTDLADETRGLQTVSTEYRPANGSGPSVWLVGVAHLGTAEYFHAIQERLDRQTVVLYEGIGLRDVKKGPGVATDRAGIQTALATALGLKFQLDAIDYRRPTFINSDLQAPELEREVRERTTAAKREDRDETFNQLMDALQGSGATGGALSQVAGVLGSSAQTREITKLMLIEVLGRAGEFLELARNYSPEMKDLFDIVLTERNTVVLRDLRAQLARLKPGQSIAVFYGAAHMDEIAQRLRNELRYVPAKQEWDTAFTAKTAESGIKPAQIRMMLDLLRTQLQPAAPAPR